MINIPEPIPGYLMLILTAVHIYIGRYGHTVELPIHFHMREFCENHTSPSCQGVNKTEIINFLKKSL